MNERERKAEEHIEQMRILPEITGDDARRESFKEGWDAAIEAAVNLCEMERVRQINGDRFERMNGQDTAFSLSQRICALGRGEQKAGGEPFGNSEQLGGGDEQG